MVVYSLSDRTLQKQASFRTSTAPIDIAITGNIIAVADLMKSVSIVEYKRGTAGLPDTLEEVARHFQTVWATAVAQVGKDAAFLESDAEGNLMVLQQNTNGITADDRRRLEVISEIRLGEMVNRIRSFDVSANPNAIVTPTAFTGTVSPLFLPPSPPPPLTPPRRAGRRLHLPHRPHRPRLPRHPHAPAIRPRLPRPLPRQHPVQQLPRIQEPGAAGGGAVPVRRWGAGGCVFGSVAYGAGGGCEGVGEGGWGCGGGEGGGGGVEKVALGLGRGEEGRVREESGRRVGC